MRVSWTLFATTAYMILAFTHPRAATVLVPAYCFVVVLPYGLAACQRRFARYREEHDGPGPGLST
jgi:hypothetical protein